MKKENTILKMDYTKYLKIVILIICFLAMTPIKGQIRAIYNVPSPEVANLGTFGGIPVGHYTGTADISVPLYSIKVGKLSIPLQALYHTSNVKPHTPPTCLGIGWALSAGGYIARKVNCCQDEKECVSRAGYYFNHTKINQIESSSNKSKKLKELTHLEGNDRYELSADEFFFSFNGYSGTFFLDKDGQWRVNSDDNIKVEFNEKGGFKTIDDLQKRFHLQLYAVGDNRRFFDKFTLITSDGTRYEFGGDNATEYCVPYYNQVNGDIIATCWRLSRIITPEGRALNFEYAADSYMCDIHFAPQTVYMYVENQCLGSQLNWGRSGYSGFLMMPVRLMKISSENETVCFNYYRDTNYGSFFLKNTQCLYWEEKQNQYYSDNYRYSYGSIFQTFKKARFYLFLNINPEYRASENQIRKEIAEKITQDYLTSISIKRNNKDFQQIKFNFHTVNNRYLLSNVKFISRESLSLNDEVDMIDSPSDDTIVHKRKENLRLVLPPYEDHKSTFKDLMRYEYKFEYYLDDNLSNQWPERNPLTYTDSWGFYSRFGYNPDIRGEWKLSGSYGSELYGVRYPSLVDTREYVLKSIVYPTGGKTLFDYELHDYSQEFDLKNGILKEVSGNVGGLRLKKMENYDISGVLLYSKKYIYKKSLNGKSSGISKGTPQFYNCIYTEPTNGKDRIDFFSFDDINPYPLNFNTPNVGYSTVFEELRDSHNQLISRKKFQYTNYDKDVNGVSHQDQCVDYTANVYNVNTCSPFTSLAFERGKLILEEVMDASNKVLERNTYEYIRSKGEPYSTISQECHLDFFLNRFSYSFLYKTYANRYLVSINKKQEFLDNGTFITENRFKYTDDGLLQNKTEISTTGEKRQTSYVYNIDAKNVSYYSWMRDKNIIVPVAIEYKKGNSNHSILYTYSSTDTGAPYISLQQSRWYTSDQLTARLYRDYSVEKADRYGNPIVLEEQGIRTVMIWSHKGQRLVASIENATYDEVTEALGEKPENFSELSSPSVSMDILRSKLDKALVYTYQYDSDLNLIQKTDPQGMSYKYTYDALRRLTAEYRVVGRRNELLKKYDYNYNVK
ncbi:MAG: RHS repeat protein [Prevotella sp.]|nr:RHS repeat protein [Prevotella sp.]